MPGWLSTWRSLGNGNFVMTPNDQGCSRPLDFNGDPKKGQTAAAQRRFLLANAYPSRSSRNVKSGG